MKKFKKLYCKISMIFAVLMVSLCLSLIVVHPVYATEYGPTDNAPNASDTTTGGNGFTLSFDGDTGSLSSTVEILLVLTVLSYAVVLLTKRPSDKIVFIPYFFSFAYTFTMLFYHILTAFLMILFY